MRLFDKQYIDDLFCFAYKLIVNLARDPKQIGNRIRVERKRKRWSQKELANQSGLRQATISLMETGLSSKLHNLLAVLAALDLELQIAPRSTSNSSGQE